MTYVAAIKNAVDRDVDLQRKKKQDKNAGHRVKGEELYNQGQAKFLQASADSDAHLDDVVNLAITKMQDSDGTQDEFDKIAEEAEESLKLATVRYDAATEKFQEAKAEFSEVDDDSCQEWMGKCDERVSTVTAAVRHLQEELDERLKAAMRNAQGKKKLAEAKEKLNDTVSEVGQTLEEALSEATDKIGKSRTEQQRIDACNEARDKLAGKAKKFQDIKKDFEDAESMLDDGEDKDDAGKCAASCDEFADSALETLNSRLNDALASAGDNDDLTDSELLAVYHAFSLEVESLLDDGTASSDVNREKGAARARLDGLMNDLKKMKSQKDATRKMLHKMIDDQMDSEGYP